MESSKKAEQNQPELTSCPKCKGERFLAEGIHSLAITKVGTKLPGVSGGVSEFWALACTNCGYTEFYAKSTAKLA